jgi:hypothetical protein
LICSRAAWIAAYPIEVLRTFQIEDFVVAEFDPDQDAAKNW